MLNKITNFLKIKKPTQSIKVRFKDYQTSFFTHPFHQWINQNRYTKATFQEFFDLLPMHAIEFLLNTSPIYFLHSSGKYSCALSNTRAHAIIVFPELSSLLRSTMMDHSLAILLHELGHIIFEHADKDIDPTKAQVEADLFAAKLGFAEQIEEFLLDQPESLEKRTRLSYLTKYVIQKN
jgi:hypothetical protein